MPYYYSKIYQLILSHPMKLSTKIKVQLDAILKRRPKRLNQLQPHQMLNPLSLNKLKVNQKIKTNTTMKKMNKHQVQSEKLKFSRILQNLNLK